MWCGSSAVTCSGHNGVLIKLMVDSLKFIASWKVQSFRVKSYGLRIKGRVVIWHLDCAESVK